MTDKEQILVFGGAISLTTTVVLAIVQAILQRFQEGYKQRQARRERFFSYDLEKLKRVETLVIEIQTQVETGGLWGELAKELQNIVLVSKANSKGQAVLMNKLVELFQNARRLLVTHKVIEEQNPGVTSREMLGMRPFALMRTQYSQTAVEFIAMYRREVLGEQ